MSSPGRWRARVRSWLSPILVTLTVVALVTSMLTLWVRTTVLDTDRFMAIVEPALSDAAFPGALSSVVAEQVLVALDLDARVAVRLEELDAYLVDSIREALGVDVDPATLARLSRRDRPTLAAFAPALATALEARVVEVVDATLSSDAFASRYPELVRRSHHAAAALLRGDATSLPYVSIDEGAVRLDLVPVIAEVLQRVVVELSDLLPDVRVPEVVDGQLAERRAELAAALETSLPEDFGQFTILSRGDLDELQATVRTMDRLVVVILALTVALLVSTLAVSRDRRRTLLQLTLGVAVGVAFAVLLIQRVEATILAQIGQPDGLRVAGVLLDEVTRNLRSVTIVVVLAALATAAVAYVAGHPERLTTTRTRP
jgi:hypothetical protein